jgi:LmbE family N-acetylglucosaminyl deacetylase
MLSLALGEGAHDPLSILCLGAHSDYIEIGCGATLMRLLRDRPGSSIRWVVFSATEARAAEARASATDVAAAAAELEVTVHDFRESYFPFEGASIKESFGALAREVAPDVVFSHRRDDQHQDHRTIGELTWNHFRDHLVVEYEIPKYEGDLGHPNLFVPLERELVERKIELLVAHFGSQQDKGWFSPDTFRGLMAVRGVECNAESGFAEAFHVRKATLI